MSPGPPSRWVAAAALASLPHLTPARLRAVAQRWPDPEEAADAVGSGRAAEALALVRDSGTRCTAAALARSWATALDLGQVAIRLHRRATRVWWVHDSDYPIADCLEDRPSVLMAEGSRPGALGRPRVAVVGTRSATPHGVADARELGADLARAGITVVSGLAIGIDAAAHEGALDAGGDVVGVVATGLDVVYPRRHGHLTARVRESGLVVSETAFGTGPEPARFPVRNRIIAALADVTVVVEATASGGAQITARYASEYGRPVFAAPGSRRNPAATGCNALIADGAGVLLSTDDVLLALGMTPGARRPAHTDPDTGPPLGSDAAALLAVLGGEPATPDTAGARAGLGPAAVARAASELVRAGRVCRAHGLLWPR